MTSSSRPAPSDAPNAAEAQAAEALPLASQFDGFEIERVLATSDFGIVYRARDLTLDCEVALKEYLPTALARRGDDQRVVTREPEHDALYEQGLRIFIQEAQMLARCDHPALLRVSRLWQSRGTAYRAMPFYPGRSLLALRHSLTAPPDEQWLRAMIDDLLGALDVVHDAGLVHRRVAPTNILIRPDNRPVLLDFDAVRQAMGAVKASAHALPQTASSDLHALAATVYFAVTGRSPSPAWGADAPRHSLKDAVQGAGATAYGSGFLKAIDRALDPDPASWPRNGEEFREWLAVDRHAAAAVGATAANDGPTASADAEPEKPIPAVDFLTLFGVVPGPEAKGRDPRDLRSAAATTRARDPGIGAPQRPAAPDPRAFQDSRAFSDSRDSRTFADSRSFADSRGFQESRSFTESRPFPTPRDDADTPHPRIEFFPDFGSRPGAGSTRPGGLPSMPAGRVSRPMGLTPEPPLHRGRRDPDDSTFGDAPLLGVLGGGEGSLGEADDWQKAVDAKRRTSRLVPWGVALLCTLGGLFGMWKLQDHRDQDRLLTDLAARAAPALEAETAATPPPQASAPDALDELLKPSPRLGTMPSAPVTPPASTGNTAPSSRTPAPVTAPVQRAPSNTPGSAANPTPVTPETIELPSEPTSAGPRSTPESSNAPTVAEPAYRNPRDACGSRTAFALFRCMEQQCERSRWAQHPSCLRLRATGEVDG